MSVKVKDIGWAAGFVEGEGTFCLQKGCPSMIVVSTDRDVIERAARLWGTNVLGPYVNPKKPQHKPKWKTAINGNRAAGWMMTIFKELGFRRKRKIKDLLARWRRSSAKPRRQYGLPIECGHPGREHKAKGKCNACYLRDAKKAKIHIG